jgi:hypothetical protein
VIYLILKMFVYLALAVLAGFGAGWLIRNLTAAKKEEELQRTLSETKARVPQFESLMRSRDDQMKTLRQEIKDKDVRFGELHEQMGLQDRAVKEKDQELRTAQSRLASLDVDDAPMGSDADLSNVDLSGEPSSNLSKEVERLKQQEQNLRAELQAAQLAQSSAATTEVFATGSTAMEEVLRSEVHELESRLRQRTTDHDRQQRALEQEQRKVLELERERELQNKSLQVLHQQLELARENGQQAASG